jgi:hypothetical protein
VPDAVLERPLKPPRKRKGAKPTVALKDFAHPAAKHEPLILTGKAAAASKHRWAYQDAVPHCGNCTSHRRARTLPVDGELKRRPERCAALNVAVSEMGCCDRWTGRNGDRLED